MSCDRCKDIHKAQVEEITQRPCGCNCHNNFYTGTITGTNDIFFNTTGNNADTITFTDTVSCDTSGTGTY